MRKMLRDKFVKGVNLQARDLWVVVVYRVYNSYETIPMLTRCSAW